jgi:diphthamide biosynthesis protein 4
MAKSMNYYQLLDLDIRSSQDHITPLKVKQAYRKALLAYHPDKQKSAGTHPTITVDDIALAFKTLSDPILRAEYDTWLASNEDVTSSAGHVARPRHTGLETVDLDDLNFDASSGSWSRSCRCGNDTGFTVTEAELEKHVDEGEIIVGCKGCSLWLRIMFGVDD